jgi:hypothetical protein
MRKNSLRIKHILFALSLGLFIGIPAYQLFIHGQANQPTIQPLDTHLSSHAMVLEYSELSVKGNRTQLRVEVPTTFHLIPIKTEIVQQTAKNALDLAAASGTYLCSHTEQHTELHTMKGYETNWFTVENSLTYDDSVKVTFKDPDGKLFSATYSIAHTCSRFMETLEPFLTPGPTDAIFSSEE